MRRVWSGVQLVSKSGIRANAWNHSGWRRRYFAGSRQLAAPGVRSKASGGHGAAALAMIFGDMAGLESIHRDIASRRLTFHRTCHELVGQVADRDAAPFRRFNPWHSRMGQQRFAKPQDLLGGPPPGHRPLCAPLPTQVCGFTSLPWLPGTRRCFRTRIPGASSEWDTPADCNGARGLGERQGP